MRSFPYQILQYIVGSILMLFVGGCIPFMPSLRAENRVDLKPLLMLDIPHGDKNLSEIIDFSRLDAQFGTIDSNQPQKNLAFYYRLDDPSGNMKIYILVTIILFDTEKEATDDFSATCKVARNDDYSSGEGEVNDITYRYCIPYLVQSRTGPDGIYPVYFQWQYYRMVVQKGNLVFIFDEKTDTTDRTAINSVIQGIADATLVEH